MKSAIFDLDGTLIDSMKIWHTVDYDYLDCHGKKAHEDLGETFKTMNMQQAAAYFQSEYGISDSIETICGDILKMVSDFYENDVLAKDGVKEFLEYFKQRKIKMCVATVNNRKMVEMALKRIGILNYFEKIFTCEEFNCDKNSPLIFEKACEFLNSKPGETYVFEDSLHAAVTAKNAGFVVVGVYDEESKKDTEALKKEADIYIKSFWDWRRES